MIKPSNIDFTAPLAALLSYEKARFAGYDLEASTEEPVVLEEHDDYTLVGIKLKTNSGKDIVRKVKAYKNGETEVVEPEEPEEPVTPRLVLTGVPVAPVNSQFTIGLELTPATGHSLSEVLFDQPGLTHVDYSGNVTFHIEEGFVGSRTINVTVKTNLGAEETFTVELEVANPMTFSVVDAPETLSETNEIQLAFVPAEYTIGTLSIGADKPGVTGFRTTGNGVGINVNRNTVADGTAFKITINVDGVETSFDTVYKKTDLNANASYKVRMTFAEDGQDVHRAYANPGDIVYAVIESTGLVEAQAVDLEMNLNNAVASIDGESTITLQPGVEAIVPILIESSTSATSLATLLVKIGADVVSASRGVTVAPVAIVPTAITLNPQDGNIGGPMLGLTYSFDVQNYSGHSVVATCTNPGVTFDTFNPAENRDFEGTIFVKFDEAVIEDLAVLDIVVTIDGLTKTTSMTYHRS
jgi:hypothetical protein